LVLLLLVHEVVFINQMADVDGGLRVADPERLRLRTRLLPARLSSRGTGTEEKTAETSAGLFRRRQGTAENSFSLLPAKEIKYCLLDIIL
jgi:hypothetical protein